MATAVIGVGTIGFAVARNLVEGGERVVLAARSDAKAAEAAEKLGERAEAATVPEAIDRADVVVLAVWLDVERQVVAQNADRLAGKVVVDPSNPIAFDAEGKMSRTLPDGESSGSVIAGLLPPGAHFVKAFGTLSGDSLASAAQRDPRVVLFYATDDDRATQAIEPLITAAGFAAVRVGGVDHAGRIEVGGDLHESAGRLYDVEAAQAAITTTAA